jgi:putative Holliday junction resolvase
MTVASHSIVTVLGFDVGAKRIGVAVGNAVSATARDLAVVDMRDEVADWNAIDKLLREWRPDALVIGDPRTLADGDQPSRQRAQRFARDAAARYALPVRLVDERSSSIEAAQRFADARAAGARKRADARQLDALAAAVIVERWLAAPGDSDDVSDIDTPTSSGHSPMPASPAKSTP